MIDVIVANPDGFNDYVAHNLPYQQRIGRIAQREFNRIMPNFKIEVEDRETAIKALEDSVHGLSAPLLETMTIRKYCAYFRIANEVYENYHRKRGFRGRIHTDPQDVPEELRDMVYYKRKKFVDVMEMYDIDSPEDFIRFATDHYGELGLSRLNIFASNYRQQGWKIVVSNSYSANAGLAIEVATALYKAGAPLLIYDAKKLLRILLEEDSVRLVPYSYHNYMGYQEEGAVYELPWEYECSDDTNSVLTKEQYKEIVSNAEWQDIEQVKWTQINCQFFELFIRKMHIFQKVQQFFLAWLPQCHAIQGKHLDKTFVFISVTTEWIKRNNPFNVFQFFPLLFRQL